VSPCGRTRHKATMWLGRLLTESKKRNASDAASRCIAATGRLSRAGASVSPQHFAAGLETRGL
jgi:hypothetical protein